MYVINHSRLWVIFAATGDTVGIGSNLYDPHDIILNDDYAYIADHATGLRVADISVSSDPELGVSTCLGGDAWSVVQLDDHLYVAVDGLGLVTLSLEVDPGDPVLSGYCTTSGTPRDIAVQDDVAYIAAGSAGLITLDITDPTSPNPFNPRTTIAFSQDVAGGVYAGVYDLLGRHVAELVNRRFPAGNHELQWDGLNTTGRTVPTGVYLVRVRTSRGEQSAKMMLVK
ncbi:T9SS type A sorting domain-containing protein [bacterium]|nr:T9SS type A sorting domain-containing protein [bacterium]